MNTIMKVAVTANEMAPFKKRESGSEQTTQQTLSQPRASGPPRPIH